MYTEKTKYHEIVDIDEVKRLRDNAKYCDRDLQVLYHTIRKNRYKTLSQLREKVLSVVIRTCGGAHEHPTNNFKAFSCPFFQGNVACLHGLENISETTWYKDIFSIGYLLSAQGYDVPNGFDDKDILPWLFESGKYDNLALNGFSQEIIQFQNRMGKILMADYVVPVQEGFELFWKEKVEH